MPERGTWMVLDLILRVCLVLLFARRDRKLDLFLPARRIRDGLCAESATAGHGFLDSGIVLCVFAWKTLGRFCFSQAHPGGPHFQILFYVADSLPAIVGTGRL